MTSEQINELAALKAALKQHIAESEKATPGLWAKDWGRIRGSDCEIITNMPYEDCFDPQWEADQKFITRARTMSPLACQIALGAIEEMELSLKRNRMSNEAHRICKRLLVILSIWKGGQP